MANYSGRSTLPTLDEAKAAAPPYRWNSDTVSYDGLPSLTAEVAGKGWLFTLGPKGGATAGGTKVAEEIGPVPPISAPEYLLRVNYGHGPPGRRSTDTYASRLRSILCCHWQVGPTDPQEVEHRGRAFNERTFGRDDNGGFQQWDGRIDGPHNVCQCCRRNQAILRAGQIRVMSAIGGTNRTTSDVRSSVADPTLPRASSTARRGPASTRCQKSNIHPADRMPRGSISRIEAM